MHRYVCVPDLLHLAAIAVSLVASAATLAGSGSSGTTARGLTSSAPDAAAGSVEPRLSNDGIARHKVSIEVARARGGKVTPRLELVYDGMAGPGPYGKGWDIPLARIELDVVRRTPDRRSALGATGQFVDARYIFVSGVGRQPLANTGNGSYRAELEREYLRFYVSQGVWWAVDGFGTRYRFALAENDRLGTPFRWHLTDAIDSNNNWARYSYRTVSAPACLATRSTSGPVILHSIDWNNFQPTWLGSAPCAAGLFKDHVVVAYEPRPDVLFLTGLSGVHALLERVKELQHSSEGPAGPERIRTVHLRYQTSFTNQRSLLARIIVTGHGCTGSFTGNAGQLANCPPEAQLPPTQFSYTDGPTAYHDSPTSAGAAGANLPEYMSEMGTEPAGFNLSGGVMYERAAMTDMDGDGRADLLDIDYNGPFRNPAFKWQWWPNLGGTPARWEGQPFETGRSFGPDSNDNLLEDGSNLIDMNGDGLPDLVRENWTVLLNNRNGFGGSFIWNVSGVRAWVAAHPPVPLPTDVRPTLTACGVKTSCRWKQSVSTNQTGSHLLATVTDLTGDGIPDYVTFSDQYDAWWVFPGYIEPAASGPGLRGGFTDYPVVWKFTSQNRVAPLYLESSTTITDPNNQWRHNLTRLLTDINGDGLKDYVTYDTVLLSTGRGFEEVVWTRPADMLLAHKRTQGVGNQVTEQYDALLDMNGDGLPDRVHRAIVGLATEQIEVGYNTGSSFRALVPWLQPARTGPLPVGKWTGNPVLARQVAGFADLNGDGLLDYVSSTSGGAWTVYYNPGGLDTGAPVPDLLDRVANGVGGGFALSYVPSTTKSDSPLPFVQYIVSQHIPFLQGPVPAPSIFIHLEGRLHQAPSNLWEFRGYGRVDTYRTGAPSRVTRYFTAQADYAGQVQLIEDRDTQSCLFHTVENTPATRLPANVIPAGSVRIPYLARQVETTREMYIGCNGTSISRGKRVLEVDDFGNATLEQDEGDLSKGGDDVYQRTTYVSGADPVRLASRITKCADPGCARPLGATILRYDGTPSDENSALGEGQVGRGNLKWVSVANYSLSNLAAPPGVYNTERYAHDQFGNEIVSVKMLDILNGSKITTVYDPAYNLFPLTVTRGLNITGGTIRPSILTTTNTHDLARGVLTSTTDPNSQTMWFTVDPFGRPTRTQVSRNRQRVTVSEQQYLYQATGMASVERKFHSDTRIEEQRRNFDGLGRPTSITRPLGSDAGNRTLNEQILAYDALGRKLYEVEPHESNRSTPMTKYFYYDSRGRVIREICTPRRAQPPPATERTNIAARTYVKSYAYGSGSSGAYRDVLDENSNTVNAAPRFDRLYHDAAGRIVRSMDRAGRTVDYEYDQLGNMRRMVRRLEMESEFCTGTKCGTTVNVELNIHYDSIGRVLAIYDPDKGNNLYSYDFAGNVARAESADPLAPTSYDSALTYSYDVLGRVVTRRAERYANGRWVVDPSVNAVLNYDSAANLAHPAPNNLRGRLAWMSDSTGVTFLGYDEQGHRSHLAKQISGVPGTWRVVTQHTRQGRVASIDYNGYEQVDFSHNSAGWLSHVVGNSGNTVRTHYQVRSFAELGLPERINRNDQVLAELWSWDAVDHRLQSVLVNGPNPAQGPLMQLSYTDYDATGRLTAMLDGRTRTDYRFTYDDAYQLKRAQAFRSPIGTGQSFDFEHVYDSLGNLRKRIDHSATGTDDKTFTYRDDGTLPHAAIGYSNPNSLLGTGELSYRNGVMSEDRRCVYRPSQPPLCNTVRNFGQGADGLLTRTAAPGRDEVLYRYDALGNRAEQQLRDSTGATRRATHYIGEMLQVEIAAGIIRATWHISANGRRLLSRTRTGATTTESHYLVDSLGSVRAVADEAGAVISRVDYLPFGRIDGATVSGGPRFTFTGREKDESGSLLFFGSRFYDPELMRFISADTIVPDPVRNISFNRFAYGHNDPVNTIDPDGHNPLLVALGIGAVLGGIAGYVAAEEAGENKIIGMLIGAAIGASFFGGSAILSEVALGGITTGVTLNAAEKLLTVMASRVISDFGLGLAGGLAGGKGWEAFVNASIQAGLGGVRGTGEGTSVLLMGASGLSVLGLMRPVVDGFFSAAAAAIEQKNVIDAFVVGAANGAFKYAGSQLTLAGVAERTKGDVLSHYMSGGAQLLFSGGIAVAVMPFAALEIWITGRQFVKAYRDWVAGAFVFYGYNVLSSEFPALPEI